MRRKAHKRRLKSGRVVNVRASFGSGPNRSRGKIAGRKVAYAKGFAEGTRWAKGDASNPSRSSSAREWRSVKKIIVLNRQGREEGRAYALGLKRGYRKT